MKIDENTTLRQLAVTLTDNHLRLMSVHLEIGFGIYQALVVDTESGIASSSRGEAMWLAIDNTIEAALEKKSGA